MRAPTPLAANGTRQETVAASDRAAPLLHRPPGIGPADQRVRIRPFLLHPRRQRALHHSRHRPLPRLFHGLVAGRAMQPTSRLVRLPIGFLPPVIELQEAARQTRSLFSSSAAEQPLRRASRATPLIPRGSAAEVSWTRPDKRTRTSCVAKDEHRPALGRGPSRKPWQPARGGPAMSVRAAAAMPNLVLQVRMATSRDPAKCLSRCRRWLRTKAKSQVFPAASPRASLSQGPRAITQGMIPGMLSKKKSGRGCRRGTEPEARHRGSEAPIWRAPARITSRSGSGLR